jgi:hypothetical protein
VAHFAELDENNIVTQVLVVHDNELLVDGVETESKGIDFLESLFGHRNCKQPVTTTIYVVNMLVSVCGTTAKQMRLNH